MLVNIVETILIVWVTYLEYILIQKFEIKLKIKIPLTQSHPEAGITAIKAYSLQIYLMTQFIALSNSTIFSVNGTQAQDATVGNDISILLGVQQRPNSPNHGLRFAIILHQIGFKPLWHSRNWLRLQI